jgi:hypothetical protein
MSYNSVTIACPELPLPTLDPQSGEIGAIRHMRVKSRLGQKQAIGFLHRNYPPPSMSHTFLELVRYASDAVETPGAAPVIALLGEKGAGKTSAAEAAFYLVDGEMPEVFDCGDRSLDEILWQPVIADSSRSLVARLEERYNSGSINPLNKTFIETELADAIVTDGSGRKSLNLSLIGPEHIQGAIKTIESALKLEGISPVTGIDISYEEGILIKVWKRGQQDPVMASSLALLRLANAKAEGAKETNPLDIEIIWGDRDPKGLSDIWRSNLDETLAAWTTPASLEDWETRLKTAHREILDPKSTEELVSKFLVLKSHPETRNGELLSPKSFFTLLDEEAKKERPRIPGMAHARSNRLVVDEIEKRLPDTGKSLQQVLLVAQGLRESHTVSKNGKSFTFSRRDMPRGFTMILTGNDANDLSIGETQGLSQSQADRISILPIGKSTEEDLTHRICQFFTGIPFGILKLLPQNNETKGRLLSELRALGTNESLSREELWLLQNHDKTFQAAKQLAWFFTYWASLTDQENPGLDDPDEERNAAFREPIGVRMAHKLILKALQQNSLEVSFALAEQSADPLQALLDQKEAAPAAKASIGARTCRVILEAIAKRCRSPVLKAKVFEGAKIAGLLRDTDEEALTNAGHHPLEDLLNDLEEQTFEIEETTKALQVSLYASMLETHAEKLGNTPPPIDELLPLRDLQAAVTAFKQQATSRTTCSTTYMININPQFLEGTRSEKAVECIPVLCPTQSKAHKETVQKLGRKHVYDNMMRTEMLLALLKTPDLGEQALDALWNESWRKHLQAGIIADKTAEGATVPVPTTPIPGITPPPKCISMADGSDEDLRIAKVLTMGKERPEASIIFQSRSLKTTWIISENGKREVLENGASKVLCFRENESKALWLHIVAEMGSAIKPNVLAALHALHSLPEEAMLEPEEAIAASFQQNEQERAQNARGLRNTKIPLRVPPELMSPEMGA